MEIASSGWGLDVDNAPMVADASDQQKFQHTWPLVTMQACFCHRIKKVNTVIVTFLSHNSDFYYWNCEFTSCNSDFIRIVRWKVTVSLYPLYSMAEISFHRFHMCKGKKQTNIKMQSSTHSHSSPLPLLLPFSDPTTPLPPTTIPLPLPDIIFLSLWFFVLFCIHKTNSKRSILLYVDVLERASTPDYSSNWDRNQQFLNISVICYLKISCYNILYREVFFQYF